MTVNMDKLKADYGNVLWSGKKCILGMPISFTRYILTDTTLYTRIGLFNIKEDEIELYRIFDKKISFTLGQRIFGCGTIAIASKDIDTPEKKLISIKKPRDVKKVLDDAVRAQRDKYYVRGRDMIGGAVDVHDDIMQDDFTEI